MLVTCEQLIFTVNRRHVPDDQGSYKYQQEKPAQPDIIYDHNYVVYVESVTLVDLKHQYCQTRKNKKK